MKTAFAVSADAKMTGMLETYINLIGKTAEKPRYFVETIGISIFIPWVKIRISKTPIVSNNPNMLGSWLDLKNTLARSPLIMD